MKSRAVPTYNENFMDYSKRRPQGRHLWTGRVTQSGGGVSSADAGALAGVRAFFLVAAFVDAFQPALDDLLELSESFSVSSASMRAYGATERCDEDRPMNTKRTNDSVVTAYRIGTVPLWVKEIVVNRVRATI